MLRFTTQLFFSLSAALRPINPAHDLLVIGICSLGGLCSIVVPALPTSVPLVGYKFPFCPEFPVLPPCLMLAVQRTVSKSEVGQFSPIWMPNFQLPDKPSVFKPGLPCRCAVIVPCLPTADPQAALTMADYAFLSVSKAQPDFALTHLPGTLHRILKKPAVQYAGRVKEQFISVCRVPCHRISASGGQDACVNCNQNTNSNDSVF